MTDIPSTPTGGHSEPKRRWLERFQQEWLSVRVFRHLIRLTFVGALLMAVYWVVIASDRYVSEANIVIRKTDSTSLPSFDLAMLVSGVPGANRADQLLLREYLLSVDMIRKLDTELDVRAHYSGWDHDPLSRFWFEDAPIEWLVRYMQTMIRVDYDELAGTLRVNVQAYEPDTAHAITQLMVREGERYMNQLGHELANTQVEFLTQQVQQSREQFNQASQALLAFQNREELLSPQASAESITAIIVELEAQRAQLQTRLDSLPKGLMANHPNIVMLKQALGAIDRQIREERSKLTAADGSMLNTTLEQFHQLQMGVELTQELYKSALVGLEKGRFDATRMLDKVSVLQAPTLPEYPLEPRRTYNTFVTLLLALMLVGILKLLEAIVRDHVD